MISRAAGGDDSDYFVRALNLVRMDDDNDDDVFDHADHVPALLAIFNSLDKRNGERILECELSGLEVDAVLRFVALVFLLIPPESHRVYIQYSTYKIQLS